MVAVVAEVYRLQLADRATAMAPTCQLDTPKVKKGRGSPYSIKAKFHYTDPTGPARTQRSFAAKKVRAGPVGSMSGPCSGI